MLRRKIAVVTSSRADFGHLLPVLQELQRRSDVLPLLWVTGSHLSKKHGHTLDEIRRAKIKITKKVPIILGSYEPAVIVAKGLMGFNRLLKRQKPDLVLVFGDRFEMLAPALACLFHRVPLAHLHGGETSAGAMDESIRHSLTKLSSLHFAAAKEYRDRLLQLGENPRHCTFTGAPGLEALRSVKNMARSDLAQELGIPTEARWVSLVYHPATRGSSFTKELGAILNVLSKQKNCFLLISAANADPAGSEINEKLLSFAKKNPTRAKFFWNLGYQRYINTLKQSDFLIGNSSSGIIEAPLLGIPSVNIGDRQSGRLMSPSVIDCAGTSAALVRAIRKARSATHKRKSRKRKSPYSKRGAPRKIAAVLARQSLSDLDQKPFFDITRRRK